MAAFRSASYSRVFCPGPLLLLVLVIRQRDPGQNIRYHTAFLNAAAFKCASYSRVFYPGYLLLLVLVIRANIRYHLALLNAVIKQITRESFSCLCLALFMPLFSKAILEFSLVGIFVLR